MKMAGHEAGPRLEGMTRMFEKPATLAGEGASLDAEPINHEHVAGPPHLSSNHPEDAENKLEGLDATPLAEHASSP